MVLVFGNSMADVVLGWRNRMSVVVCSGDGGFEEMRGMHALLYFP
jgi:hypothetical protein